MQKYYKEICAFTLLGLGLSLLLDAVHHSSYHNDFFAYVLPVLFSLLYVLAYDGNHVYRLVASSLAVALFLSALLMPFGFWTDFGSHSGFLCIIFPILSYVVHVFHYAFHRDNSWRVQYSTLFKGVWNTIILVTFALIFCLVGLFLVLGYDFLRDSHYHAQHRENIQWILFFTGIAIGQRQIKVIDKARFLLLKGMFCLLPGSIIILIACFLAPIGQTFAEDHNLTTLLILSMLGIIFFNVLFQDGNKDIVLPYWLKYCRVGLFILTVIMMACFIIESAEDINVFIPYLVVTLYASLYAVTAFFPEEKEKLWVQRGNVAVTLFFVVSLYFFNFPYFPRAFVIGMGPPPPY
ncbi:MAG: hypothetical protein P1U32_01625 [Legionellaceae bacterium]|nr:hypothetical protein [Legionellaceae bacterium]